jgi:hypothetical protein
MTRPFIAEDGVVTDASSSTFGLDPKNQTQVREANQLFTTISGSFVMEPFIGFSIDCRVTIYTLNFAMLNGSIAKLDAAPTNPELAGSLVWGGKDMPLPTALRDTLSTGLSQASAQSTKGTAIEESMAMTLRRATVTYMGTSLNDVTVEAPNLQKQIRRITLDAQVPLASLWTLVSLRITFTVFGIVSAVWALVSHSRLIAELWQRLNVVSIVADWCRVPRYDQAGLDIGQTFYDTANETGLERVLIKRVARVWVLVVQHDGADTDHDPTPVKPLDSAAGDDEEAATP